MDTLRLILICVALGICLGAVWSGFMLGSGIVKLFDRWREGRAVESEPEASSVGIE